MSGLVCDICGGFIDFANPAEEWEYDDFDQPCHSYCLDEEAELDYNWP